MQRRFPFPFVSCSCSLRVRQFCSLHSHFVAHKTALNFRPLGLRLVARPGARPTHDNGMYIYFPIPGMNSPPGSGGVFQGSPPAPQQLQQQQQQQHGVSSSMSPMSDVIQLGTHQGPPSPSASPTTPAHFRSLPNRGHSSAAAAAAADANHNGNHVRQVNNGSYNNNAVGAASCVEDLYAKVLLGRSHSLSLSLSLRLRELIDRSMWLNCEFPRASSAMGRIPNEYWEREREGSSTFPSSLLPAFFSPDERSHK